MKLAYPAVFSPNGNGFTVTVPDLPGCVTEGATLADAIAAAEDAAAGWVLDELEENKSVPAASAPGDIHAGNADDIVNMIVLDIDAYAEKYGQKTVRKNLTIPAWLNTCAEKSGVNFSRVLTNALTELVRGQ